MGNGSTITLLADGIRLEGFTMTGSGSYPEAGIRITSSNNTLRGNVANSNLQSITINWIPQSTGNYTIEAWGRGMIESAPVYVYDTKVVPVTDIGIIVLIAAVLLGFIGVKRR